MPNFWVDPERLQHYSEPYRPASEQLHVVSKELDSVVSLYEGSWGDDVVGNHDVVDLVARHRHERGLVAAELLAMDLDDPAFASRHETAQDQHSDFGDGPVQLGSTADEQVLDNESWWHSTKRVGDPEAWWAFPPLRSASTRLTRCATTSLPPSSLGTTTGQ